MAKANKLKPRGLEAGAVYPKQEFLERMGWAEKAFRSAKQRGLPTHKESRYIYVLADEAAEWMKGAKTTGATS